MNHLFASAYAGRRVLVTGHTGFKGSWLCLWLSEMGARVTGLALAPDTQPSHWDLLALSNVGDLRLDLRDASAVARAVQDVEPEVIFHLAAQPLVRRSYREPVGTFDTNVMGLVNLLEAVRSTASVRAFVNATTDKVYLEQACTTGYREENPLGGHDPYSTSKACAELVTECYRKSFFCTAGPCVATARAGNVIGGGDWSEDRLIPDLVRAATSGATVQIRNPNAIRPWQHVLEPLAGYLQLGQQLLAGKTAEGAWNFGPAADATLAVHELVALVQVQWPHLHDEAMPGHHPHEAALLRLDTSKAHRQLGWHPLWNAQTTLKSTVQWYRDFYERGHLSTHENLHAYVAAARAAGMGWAA